MNLKETQELFVRSIMQEDTTAIDALSPHILQKNGIPSRERIDIYRKSVYGALLNALAGIYPVVQKLVGDEFFDRMMQKYIDDYPSCSPDLADFGDRVPEFLDGFEPIAQIPYLHDIARLEWAWHRIFHAKDEEGFDFTQLEHVPEPDQGKIFFMLPDESVLIHSLYPIIKIWQVNQEDYSGDLAVSLDEGGVKCLVWRKGYETRIDVVEDNLWPYLVTIAEGRPLDQLCEGLSDCTIDEALPALVQNGWITGFKIDSEIL